MSATCVSPPNHARLMEYIVDKHAEAYRRFGDGVVTVIERRIAHLEAALQAPPPARPKASRGENGWRQAILDLENHRRALEEIVMAPSREPESDGFGVHEVDWGSLRQLEPVSRVWGLDRGQPVDRYYIEHFLERHSDSITGDVLEVKDSGYAGRFGRRARSFTTVDVAEHNREASLVVDLSHPDALPEQAYDCFILTQTIHVIYDVEQVVRNAFRTLAPKGVLLATLPCVSRVDYESGVGDDFWRFTPASAQRLFQEHFGASNVKVEAYGNVLACTAFLQGITAGELSPSELDERDPYFPLLVAVRAVKPGTRRARHKTGALEGQLDGATCRSIFGWAWDPGAPEQRLRLDVWMEERQVGTTTADRFRPDLEQAGKGGGRVAFEFLPGEDLHRRPPGEVKVTLVGDGEVLTGSPRPIECVCGRDTSSALLGSAVDLPRPGGALPFPWLDIAGWAVGRTAQVEAVELVHKGVVFRRTPVGLPRPDLADAFRDAPQAARAGFATRISFVGVGSSVELDLRGVMTTGETVPFGRIEGHAPAEEPVLPAFVLLDAEGVDPLAEIALLGQTAHASRVLVRNGGDLTAQPAFVHVTEWNALLDASTNGLIWLTDSRDAVTDRFLSTAAQGLAEVPEAAFVTAIAPGARPDHPGLIQALSGTALGVAVAFRADVARALGGFDASTASAAAAQWDLCIRAAEAGYGWVEVGEVAQDDAPTISERAGGEGVRWLYRKHAPTYKRHLKDVLLDREVVIADLLRRNHVSETRIECDLWPLARARRRERDRLGAKARQLHRAGVGVETGFIDWGDFRRFEPVSRMWGSDRGLCVDRYYIERFLQRHAHDVRGVVLEVHDSVYARRYGGAELARCEVIDNDATNPTATIFADLRDASSIDSSTYDCLILTQTLQLIHENEAVLRECRRILKPGGVLLASVPCVSRVDPESGLDGDHWRYTESALRALLEAAFGEEVDVRMEGNRVAALGFLAGLAAEEVGEADIDDPDPSAPLLLTARAVKPAQGYR